MTGERPRILGIDPGKARIGLALSDPLGITAQPLGCLECVGPRKDLNRIAALVREHEAEAIVIGLPRLLSGEEGEAAAASRQLAEGLGRRLPGVRIELWDERLTTVEAERTMISADVKRRERRAVVDALAAVLILQGYLDAQAAGDGTWS